MLSSDHSVESGGDGVHLRRRTLRRARVNGQRIRAIDVSAGLRRDRSATRTVAVAHCDTRRAALARRSSHVVMLRSRSMLPALCSLLIAGLTACDRETAPQVRDAIESAQRQAFEGSLGTISASVGLPLEQVANRLFMSSVFPRDTIIVERGTERRVMLATVLERVYVPTGETGARPYVRRTVLLWEQSSKVGFVVMSDDSIAAVSATYFSGGFLRRSAGRMGAVLEVQNRQTWFGRDGTIEFMDGLKTGSCPFGDKASAENARVMGQDAQAPDATCERMRYPVSVRATLERGDPTNRSALETVAGNHPSLFIDAQIPGLRFVTRCRAAYPRDTLPPEGCSNAMAFWREESQFASQLGVEWSRFREQQPGWYAREIAPGTGRLYTDVPRWREGPVRYRVLAPDGHLIASGLVDDIDVDGPMSALQGLGQFRPGYHGMLVTPARYFDATAGPYAVTALDFEFLPPENRSP